MKLNNGVISFLLLNPLLLIFQFLMGFVVYQKVQLINSSRKLEADERTYLRNNLLALLLAETSQRVYLMSGDSVSFKTYNESLVNIANNKIPASFLIDPDFNEIPRLTQKRVHYLEENIRFLSTGKNDSILPMIKTGGLIRDSVKMINEKHYALMDQRFDAIEKSENRWLDVLLPISIFIFSFNLLYVIFSIRKIRNGILEITALNIHLEAQNKQLQLFTFMTYHNLKEPLRHISGFLQILERKYISVFDEADKDDIKMSVDAAKKIGTMISDLREKHLGGTEETNP